MYHYATKLEKVLHERSINQSALARKIGVDRSLMNKWVKGRHTPSARFMTLVARELRMTEQDIFFDADFSDMRCKNALTIAKAHEGRL